MTGIGIERSRYEKRSENVFSPYFIVIFSGRRMLKSVGIMLTGNRPGFREKKVWRENLM